MSKSAPPLPLTEAQRKAREIVTGLFPTWRDLPSRFNLEHAIASALLTARREGLEEAAAEADIWAETKPVKGPHAPMMATVMSHTAQEIATSIRSLIEGGD